MIACLCQNCQGRVVYLTVDAYLAHANGSQRSFVLVKPKADAS